MIFQLLTIARNAFTESIRQPVLVVLILVGTASLVLNTSLAAYSMEPGGAADNKMLTDMGFSTLFVIGLLLAAFTATSVLSSEVENKTVLTVISKPVSRPLFVVGKYFGVTSAIAVAFYVLSLVFIFTVRHRVMSTAAQHLDEPVLVFGFSSVLLALILASWGNYMYRWVFTSTFVINLALFATLALIMILMTNKRWQFQSPLTEFQVHGGELWQVIIGLVMVFEAVIILAAVAIAASTRLGQLMTLLTCSAVFAVGLITQSLSQWTTRQLNRQLELPLDLSAWDSFVSIFQSSVPIHLKLIYGLTKIGYVIFPNLQLLWPADAITQNHPISISHLATVSAYTGAYITLVVSAAIILFQTREVG